MDILKKIKGSDNFLLLALLPSFLPSLSSVVTLLCLSFFCSLFVIHCFFIPFFDLFSISLFFPLSFSHLIFHLFIISISLPLFNPLFSITIFSSPSRCYFTPLSCPRVLLLSVIPFLFSLFIYYVRLCTAENRLSVYSGSVSAVLRASPLRSRISRKTTRFIHGDHRYARFADTSRRN